MDVVALQSAKAYSLRLVSRPRRRELALPAGPPSFMASSPTVTLSAANAASTITNAFTYSIATLGVGAIWRLRGGTYAEIASGRVALTNPTDPPASTLAIVAETATDAAAFEVLLRPPGTTLRYRLWVDGQVVTVAGATATGVSSAASSGGADYRVKVDFGARPVFGMRTIRVETNSYLGGVTVSNGDALAPSPVNPAAVSSMWVGDSFLEGTGADAAFTGIPYVASKLLGWDEVILAAQGGTGYLNPSAITGRVTFRSRLASLVGFTPQKIVVAGGYNDLGAYPLADIQAEVALFFPALRAAFPTADVYALGPWSLYSPTEAARTTLGGSVQAAVQSIGGSYLDNVGGALPWINGTGTVANPAVPLNGNASRFVISAVDPHTPQAGHDYYGFRIASAIAPLIAA